MNIYETLYEKLLRSFEICILKTFCYLIRFTLPGLRFSLLRTDRLGHLTGDCATTVVDFYENTTALFSESTVVVFIKENYVCNTYVARLIQRSSPPNIRFILIKNSLLKFIINEIIRLKIDNSFIIILNAILPRYGDILSKYNIFKPSQLEIDVGKNFLFKKNKLNINKKNVFVHNRDTKFLGKGSEYHSYRDFDPDIFFEIIKKYSAEYNFIRGGISAVKPLHGPENSNYLDLPFTLHSDIEDYLSQYLSSFYFGSDSGINTISLIHGIPVAGINFPINNIGFFMGQDIYKLGLIFKKLWDLKLGRYLSLSEMYERKLNNIWYSDSFAINDVVLIENSSSEVICFFDECVEKMNNQQAHVGPTDLQSEAFKIISYYERKYANFAIEPKSSFIGADFLSKNIYLIQ